MIWDAARGMRNLRDVLVADFGLEASLIGWTLFEANAVSPDGKFITGTGINPDGETEAWIVGLGASTEASADFDSDGDVDGNDFLVWQRGHGVGTTDEQGDANGDGAVTGEDLTIWIPSLDRLPQQERRVAIPEPGSALQLLAATTCRPAEHVQSEARLSSVFCFH